MYKLKKKTSKAEKAPVLYNIIEDYTEFDPPGNVVVCAMTEPEDLPTHARILSESYEIPLEVMTTLLAEGGVYVYPGSGGLVTRGLFACHIDPSGTVPKQTWVLDLVQYSEAEQLVRALGISLEEAARRVFYRTLPPELKVKIEQKTLGLDERTPDRAVAQGSEIKYIDFRKDWSPHFKRLCMMPDGSFVETGGLHEFAALHRVSVADAKRLLEDGGILEVDGEVLACQVINGQPAVARFSRAHYAKAKALAVEKQMHILDALSEVAFNDPVLMRALRRKASPS